MGKLGYKRGRARGVDYSALGSAGAAKKLAKYSKEELSEQAKRAVATRNANRAARLAGVTEPEKPPPRVRRPKLTPEELLEAQRASGHKGGTNRARNLGPQGLHDLQRRAMATARGFANTPKEVDDNEPIKFSSWGNQLTERDLLPTRRKNGG